MSSARKDTPFASSFTEFKALSDTLTPLKDKKTVFHWQADNHSWQRALFYQWYPRYVHEFEAKVAFAAGIKRIRFYDAPRESMRCKLDIVYQNHAKQALEVPRDKVKPLTDILTQMQARTENMLIDALARPRAWERMSAHYDAKVCEEYAVLRQKIIKHVLIEAKNLASPEVTEINLVDIGCGTTVDFALQMFGELSAAVPSVKFRLLGFDKSTANIDECNQMPHPSSIKFVVGDSLNLQALLAEEKHLAVGPQSRTILVSSGSITRQVLKDAYHGLQVFQESWLTGADVLIITGKKEPLLLPRMMKRVGFIDQSYENISIAHSAPSSFAEEKHQVHEVIQRHYPLYVLKRKPDETVFKEILKKLIKRPEHLDLSMSACPLIILQKLATLPREFIADLKVIDLSYSRVGRHADLVAALKSYPAVKIIYTAKSVAEVQELIVNFPLQHQLEVRAFQDEYALAGSQNFLARWQVPVDALKETYGCLPLIVSSSPASPNYRDKNENCAARVALSAQDKEAELLNWQFFLLGLLMQHQRQFPQLEKDGMRICFNYLIQLLMEKPFLFKSLTSANQILSQMICYAEIHEHLDKVSILQHVQYPLGHCDWQGIDKILPEVLTKEKAFARLVGIVAIKKINIQEVCKQNSDILFATLKSKDALKLIEWFHQLRVDFLAAAKEYPYHTLLTYLFSADQKQLAELKVDFMELIKKILALCPSLLKHQLKYSSHPLLYVADSPHAVMIMRFLLEKRKDLTLFASVGSNRPLISDLVNNQQLLTFFLWEKGWNFTVPVNVTGLSFFKKFSLSGKSIVEHHLYDLLMNWGGEFQCNLEERDIMQWKGVLMMLLGPNAFQVDNPVFEIRGIKILLSQTLEMLLNTIIAKPSLLEKCQTELGLQELISGIKAVAEKYHCPTVLEKLAKHGFVHIPRRTEPVLQLEIDTQVHTQESKSPKAK